MLDKEFIMNETSTKILMLLLFYNGMSVKNLTVFTTDTLNYNPSNEKTTYSYLSALIKIGLVEVKKMQENELLESMYLLTKDGLVFTKKILDIDNIKNLNF
jgi:predicted transcriptional regulator